MDKKDIAVIIPIYLPTLFDTDKTSLEQCLKLLSEYEIIIIKPENLEVKELSLYSLSHIETFSDESFVSLRAYNKLVLTEGFYRRFRDYKYILIYQLDAYVFKDELLFWAEKGYDYIGAPWLPWKRRHLSDVGRLRLFWQRLFCKYFNKKAYMSDKYYAYEVGNGGFSLRKTSKMLEVVIHYKDKIDRLLDDNAAFYPEDIFLLHELTDRKFRLKKPGFKEALRFAVEEKPDWVYSYYGKQLPFGCHAWCHKDYYPFWKFFIDKKLFTVD